MQSLVQIGSEMWICIRYKQTQKQTNKQTNIHLYIQDFIGSNGCVCVYNFYVICTQNRNFKIVTAVTMALKQAGYMNESFSEPAHVPLMTAHVFTYYFNTLYHASFIILYSDQQMHTIISQIITLLHVSTLSCHPQTACNQYLAKLHKYFKCSCW